MFDDEGVGGDFGGGKVEAEAFDVPMGERVGVVGGDGALGQLGVGVVEPVDDKVVAAREAGVVLDRAATAPERTRAKSAIDAAYRLRCGLCPGPYKT